MDLYQLLLAVGTAMVAGSALLYFNRQHGWVAERRYDAVAADVLATAGFAVSAVAELLRGLLVIAGIYGLFAALMATAWWINARDRRNTDNT
ncbi:hypothetical protein [Actinomadura kijaniata]|uniref:hypothetical protein n=1 Tax=Actinomadura kijaniata TaxID=46161 RepID=UPI00083440F4|nr:hypothetical protein [Actinomadura kijaniata]